MDNLDEVRHGLQFIAVTAPGHGWKSSHAEYLIRSRAAQHYRKERRLKMKKVSRSLDLKCQESSFERGEYGALENALPKSTYTSLKATSTNIYDDTSHQCSDRGEINFQLHQITLHQMSARDHQLLAHVSNFYTPLMANLSEKFVLWTSGVKQFLAIAFSHDFAMHAILAWSATHLAKMTGNNLLQQDAYKYRSLALRGLQAGIECFSKENADAVLSTSIVMSWQSVDADSWKIMKRGCASLTAQMESWDRLSTFTNAKSGKIFQSSADASLANIILAQPRIDLPKNLTRREALKQAAHSLAALRVFVSELPFLSDGIDELVSFLETFKDSLNNEKSAQRHDRLESLRSKLFWFPNRFLPWLNTHPAVMVLMAHLHAVALIIDPVTNGNSSSFRGLNAVPIYAFHEEISIRAKMGETSSEDVNHFKRALPFMEYPLKAVAAFQSSMDSLPCPFGNEQSPRNPGSMLCVLKRHRHMSTLQVLEDLPVGLWQNSIS